LGKPFYVQKKYPHPIKLDYTNKEEIKKEIVSHVEYCSTFHMNHGPNYSLKIARESEQVDVIEKNFMDGLIHLIPHILKWGVDLENLQTISIKGTNTVDLPIFNQLSSEDINLYFEN